MKEWNFFVLYYVYGYHEWVTAVNSTLSLYCVNSFVDSINDDASDGRRFDCRLWIEVDAVIHEIDNIDFTSFLNCDAIADVPRISSTFGIGIPLSSLSYQQCDHEQIERYDVIDIMIIKY